MPGAARLHRGGRCRSVAKRGFTSANVKGSRSAPEILEKRKTPPLIFVSIKTEPDRLFSKVYGNFNRTMFRLSERKSKQEDHRKRSECQVPGAPAEPDAAAARGSAGPPARTSKGRDR